MIHVDRSAVPVPKFFESEADEHRDRVLEFYERSEKVRKQSRAKVDMRPLRTGEVKKALYELFSGKCAYCEQPLTTQAAEVSHFRPKSLYPFLTYDWENLYLTCPVCNRNKAARFPLKDGASRALGPEDDLANEVPLLLDPCDDKPLRDLAFEAGSGRVVPRQSGDTDRAKATIRTLGLNRSDLLKQRKSARARQRKALRQFVLAENAEDAADPLEGVRGSTPFAAVSREESVSWLNVRSDSSAKQVWQRKRLDALVEFLVEVGYESFSRQPGRSPGLLPPKLGTTGLRFGPSRHQEVQRELADLPASNAWIQSIELIRFKCIERLKLEPCAGPQEEVLETEEDEAAIPTLKGWMTLLGENGCGKSSILQAVSLALAGERILTDTGLEPKRFLMRGRGWGEVRLGLSTGDEIVLRIYKKSFKFLSGGEPHGIFVRAYGPTRLLPLEETEEEVPAKTARVVYRNMFNPFQPLLDADAWLRRLEDEFDAARLAIKDLLDLADGQEVELVDGKVRVDGQPLENLSAGYQTLVALACDIMAGAPGDLTDMHLADGIVLVDEIGSHLHPAWKMRIVARLRQTFPLMQFLVSTHEPLCLRGLSQGEVLLVRRDLVPGQENETSEKPRVVTVDADLPSPSRLRVDQLLTSQHFGLNSTIDPRVDRLFDEYYQLLARKDELDDQQNRRCAELSRQLQRHGILGYTRRDQLVYEAIDEFLAYEEAHRHVLRGGEDAGESRGQRWETVKKRVADLWSYASVVPAESGR